VDPLAVLSKEARRVWARHPAWNINETVAQLLAFPVKPTIEVRMVGWDGTGQGGLRISDRQMMRYLQALRADMDTPVVDSLGPTFLVRKENTRSQPLFQGVCRHACGCVLFIHLPAALRLTCGGCQAWTSVCMLAHVRCDRRRIQSSTGWCVTTHPG
jgi:hypothetical protein